MQEYKKICVTCPAGCHLLITKDEATGEITVTGNKCPRGAKYATQEMTDPRRIVTTVVSSDEAFPRRLPVKSNAPVPISLIPELIATLTSMKVPLPISLGQVILKDYKGIGIDIVAADELK